LEKDTNGKGTTWKTRDSTKIVCAKEKRNAHDQNGLGVEKTKIPNAPPNMREGTPKQKGTKLGTRQAKKRFTKITRESVQKKREPQEETKGKKKKRKMFTKKKKAGLVYNGGGVYKKMGWGGEEKRGQTRTTAWWGKVQKKKKRARGAPGHGSQTNGVHKKHKKKRGTYRKACEKKQPKKWVGVFQKMSFKKQVNRNQEGGVNL